MYHNSVKLIECPRDAMQGWKKFIPTEKKIEYINSLLKVGFDTIDFGSFVSPKAIPQMADTTEVVGSLELGVGSTKLLRLLPTGVVQKKQVCLMKLLISGFLFLFLKLFSNEIPIHLLKNRWKG